MKLKMLLSLGWEGNEGKLSENRPANATVSTSPSSPRLQSINSLIRKPSKKQAKKNKGTEYLEAVIHPRHLGIFWQSSNITFGNTVP